MTDFVKKLFQNLTTRPKVIFPEGDNAIIQQAAKQAEEYIESILLSDTDSLDRASIMLKTGEVDAMVAGIDYTSRDVIVSLIHAFRENKEDRLKISSSFVIDFGEQTLMLADAALAKNPTSTELSDIILQTVATYEGIFTNQSARVACLSFSTLGSGGNDLSIDKIREAIEIVRQAKPDLLIDGEIQLDAAVNPQIVAKKAPSSPVAGQANVLIVPDLNSGNILYKSFEQFAGAHAYGPILQGFGKPVSDLSRGSSLEDVLGVIAIVAKQAQK